ncbi:MAG: MurT ligase domain-containing protein [Mycobacteriales bacterium]
MSQHVLRSASVPVGSSRWVGVRGWVPLGLMRAADAIGAASRRSGRGAGGTLPGRFLLQVRPSLFADLLQRRPVVLVSGTNGKTTTTALLAAALSAQPGRQLVTNVGGDNLLAGLLTALLGDRHGESTAVLEVDERVLPVALEAAPRAVVVLLNLTRDQLDRYSEVSLHKAAWSSALAQAPGSTIIANADDPLIVAAVRVARPEETRVIWVAAGHAWRRDAVLCPFCHGLWDAQAVPWSCDACGQRAPEVDWVLRDGAVQRHGKAPVPLQLALPGRAATMNAVMALATAATLGVPVDAALPHMQCVAEVGGRYRMSNVRGHDIRLLLAKNPAGWTEVLQQIVEESTAPVLIGINARAADGADASWLWDVPFEQLTGRPVVAFGERRLDLSTRLEYAGVAHDVAPSLTDALLLPLGGTPLVVANYTAFVQARRELAAAAVITVG